MPVTAKRFMRKERRHQLNRKQTRRIVERRQKWFHLTEGGNKSRSTPVCLDPEYIEVARANASSDSDDI